MLVSSIIDNWDLRSPLLFEAINNWLGWDTYRRGLSVTSNKSSS